MRDLKDLLEPLGDRPMPDRWDAIQHRPAHPMPEPHRSRLGAGIAAAAVAILAIGVIVWLSPLRGTGPEPESSTSPQPSQYVSPQGWTVPLPPGWTTREFSIDEPEAAMQGTVISDQSVGSPKLNEFAIPLIPTDRFPSDAVALIVGDLPDATQGGMQPVRPPLAYSDFVQAGSSGESSLRSLTFEGPRQLFFATTQVGADASAADLDALRATIAGLAFGDEAGTLPSPSGSPGLPTQDSAADDGSSPRSSSTAERSPCSRRRSTPCRCISQADARQLLLASPAVRERDRRRRGIRTRDESGQSERGSDLSVGSSLGRFGPGGGDCPSLQGACTQSGDIQRRSAEWRVHRGRFDRGRGRRRHLVSGAVGGLRNTLWVRSSLRRPMWNPFHGPRMVRS